MSVRKEWAEYTLRHGSEPAKALLKEELPRMSEKDIKAAKKAINDVFFRGFDPNERKPMKKKAKKRVKKTTKKTTARRKRRVKKVAAPKTSLNIMRQIAQYEAKKAISKIKLKP